MKDQKFTFLQKVTFAFILKEAKETSTIAGREKTFHKWRKAKAATTEGVVIGKRTLRNGLLDYFPEEPPIYGAKESFPAYLVAFNMKENPVYVLPEDLRDPEAPVVTGGSNSSLSGRSACLGYMAGIVGYECY